METGYQYTKNIPLALTVSGLFLYEFFNILPSYLNNTVLSYSQMVVAQAPSIILNSVKDIVLTFNSLISSPSFLDSSYLISMYNQSLNLSPLMTNNNWPETLISSYTQIVSVAYSLYTYGAFWFILLGFILLLAMIAPIYLSRK